MGKSKKKANQRKSYWTPPKGASAYFFASSDEDFKRRHPVGYVFLVLLGLAAFLAPMIVYGVYVISNFGNEGNGWFLLGLFGSMAIGVGLFNFVAIIINQYLGHLVSVLSFLLGGIMIAVSLRLI
jgi:hypothetical protein